MQHGLQLLSLAIYRLEFSFRIQVVLVRGLHRVLHATIDRHPEFIEDIVVLANFIFEHLLPARIHLREIRRNFL